ncbi:MAG: serine/threonine-protein kinase [Candidatus Woesearchaeota archaeon]
MDIPKQIGNYEVVKKIGEGGFGYIYQVRHPLLDEYACIKENKEALAEHVELLTLEAKILWRLNEHHSIPSTKDFFKVSHNQYALVMSYIQGPTLAEIISKHSRIHPEDATWIVERLFGAMYYAHANGIIHGDIKPENVFVESKKHDIKLIDFGLASYKPTADTKPLGYTTQYAAPEIIDGKPPIPETDIYGAGIILLSALGGDVRKKSIPTDTPQEITDFCMDLLKFDPIERPSWNKNDPLVRISDIREHVFGRRHMK